MATKAVPTQQLFMEAMAHHERGSKLLEQGDSRAGPELARSIEIYQTVLNVEVEQPDVLFMLAAAHIQLDSTGVAVALLEKVLRISPDYLEATLDLGTAHMREFRKEAAVALFRDGLRRIERARNKGAEIKLRSSETVNSMESQFLTNMGALHVNEGAPDEGIPYLRKALKINPKNTHAHWNLSLLLLEAKRWQEGFKEYEWGYANNNRHKRTYGPLEPLPDWDGSPGKRLIVYGEQGQGDEILFAGFLPEVIRMSRSVILDCNPALLQVFQDSFPGQLLEAVYPTRKVKDPEWAKNYVGRVDAKISLASLGRWLASERLGKFCHAPYLCPREDQAKAFREHLQATYGDDKPIIGIAWYGGYKRTRTDQRMIPLDQWGPVFRALPKGTIVVSLQYNDSAGGEVTAYMRGGGRDIVHLASINAAVDYAPKLALAAACDLAICVNMTMVHAMGASGLECWTLTPYAHAWRYGTHGDERMPWYQSVRQFHQGKDRDWAPVMERVGSAVRARFSDG